MKNSKHLPLKECIENQKGVEFKNSMECKLIADELLEEWHAWSATYRPALGIPGCAPSCREATTSKQWDSTFEIGDERVRAKEMENVEWCVDAIPLPCRQAIGVEMKNRETRANVWRAAGAANYADAIEAILPFMRKRGLFD